MLILFRGRRYLPIPVVVGFKPTLSLTGTLSPVVSMAVKRNLDLIQDAQVSAHPRSGGFQETVSKVSSQEPGRTWRDDLRHQPSHYYVIRPQIPSFP